MTREDTLAELLNRIIYDLSSPSGIRWDTGKCAGTLNHDGYYILIKNKHGFMVHVLIWLLHNQQIPLNKIIDHKDLNRSNNDINNLRLASKNENAWNAEKYITNTSGIKGLSWHKSKNKWQGNIVCKGKIHHKTDVDMEVIKKWLIETRKTLHGDFARN